MASVSKEETILGDVSSAVISSSISKRGTFLEEYKKMSLTPMQMVGGKPVFKLASPDYSRARGSVSSPPLPVQYVSCDHCKEEHPSYITCCPKKPCTICFMPQHSPAYCPFLRHIPKNVDYDKVNYHVACGCGEAYFDEKKWLCPFCGEFGSTRLVRKYCHICFENTQHQTHECPEDKIAAAVFRAINDYHLSHMNTKYSPHSDLDASLRARREYSNEMVRVVKAAKEEALRDCAAAAPQAADSDSCENFICGPFDCPQSGPPQYQREGPPPQQRGGGSFRPELHQATPPSYQAAGPPQLIPFVRPEEKQSEAGFSTQSVASEVSEQLQDLTLQQPNPAPTQEVIPASSKSVRFPLRPGKGSKGISCIVKANHFLAELPDKDLHQYDVTITPEVASRGVNRAVMTELVTLYKVSHLGNRLPVYDGRKSLYTAGALPFTSKDFRITLTDEEEGVGGFRREREFKVVIKFAARADLHHLGMFLQGKQADAPQEALQVLDIVLREKPTRMFFAVGRSFYHPYLGRRQPLGEGLESWRGFYQSIRPTQMGLSLNIDMSSTAFIEPLPVIEFVSKLLNRDISSRSPLSDADRVLTKKSLGGVMVEVTHRGNMRHKYRISGLTSQTTRELTFPVDERGTLKSVVEYFEETYGFVIQNTQLPCLQVGNTQKPNYLPMEVCKIVMGQRYSKRLNERQITALLKATCKRPLGREMDIIETVFCNEYDEDRFAVGFGIKISKEMALVEARVLHAPRLKYHESGREKDCVPSVGQWNMKNKRMIDGGIVNNWICINFARNIEDNSAHNFCYELAQMCNTSGMAFNPESVLPVLSGPPDQVERVLKTRFHDAMVKLKPLGRELDLLIVILPENNGSLYGDLKRICETDLGIVSQCCLAKHVFKMSKQYLANVALKINVKAGGRNTVLADALTRRIPFVSDQPTIIFGADVTHPHPGEDSSPSIAAVVASQDWPEITKYAGLVCAQAHRQELIQDLYKTWQDPVMGTMHGGMIMELLISFFRATGQKPTRIIFYRDGVSEGQFYQVLLYELDAIRKACAALEPNYQPTVTFVVVQKRHHTRLFAYNHFDKRSVDGSGNILPGTVVDSEICHPTEFDFYLCSHAGIKGTSRPAHYHVLWDENKFTADALQSLSNNLCYTYARCTRSVSIVPPAYYAHLAAFRARFYLEPETSDSGSMASAAGRGAGARSTRHPGAANAAVRPLRQLRENVKRVMFFC